MFETPSKPHPGLFFSLQAGLELLRDSFGDQGAQWDASLGSQRFGAAKDGVGNLEGGLHPFRLRYLWEAVNPTSIRVFCKQIPSAGQTNETIVRNPSFDPHRDGIWPGPDTLEMRDTKKSRSGSKSVSSAWQQTFGDLSSEPLRPIGAIAGGNEGQEPNRMLKKSKTSAKTVPQGLKPVVVSSSYGTTKVVP
jgi:hypothetical protein